VPPEPRPGADQATFVAALAGESGLEGVHDGQGRDAAHRFAVYRNNVIVSLRDALRAAYPATLRLMGETFFDAAAVDFARAHKPRSPVLSAYGAGFAEAIATLPGLAPYPFVPEVAALEYARLSAYHAADAPPLAPDRLAGLPPDLVAAAVFTAHPATRLVAVPAGGLGAYRDNAPEGIAILDGAGGDTAAALVTRPAMTVLITPLTAAETPFVEALLSGAPLGTAAGSAAGEAFDLAATLARLLGAGAFAACKTGNR